jgi:hypothetical protein
MEDVDQCIYAIMHTSFGNSIHQSFGSVPVLCAICVLDTAAGNETVLATQVSFNSAFSDVAAYSAAGSSPNNYSTLLFTTGFTSFD